MKNSQLRETANKENLSQSFFIPANSRSSSKSPQQKQIRSEVFAELDKKISLHFSGKSAVLQELRKELKILSDKYEEEILRNQHLSQEKEALKKENATLGEIIDHLRKQVPEIGAENPELSNVQELQAQIDELTQELSQYKRTHIEKENLSRELEEIKKERDFLYINIERDKASYEARIRELKESYAQNNFRIEERILEEARSKHILSNDLNKCLEQAEKWKRLYLAEAKNVLSLQKQYKSLIEDNKCHTEYILDLENRFEKLNQNYYELYNDYHKKLTEFRIENLKNVQNEIEKHKSSLSTPEYSKFENAVLVETLQEELTKEKERGNDLRIQINLLVTTKEELQRNLSMSRHHALELVSKLEDEAGKVAALEDLRIGDLQYIAQLERDKDL